MKMIYLTLLIGILGFSLHSNALLLISSPSGPYTVISDDAHSDTIPDSYWGVGAATGRAFHFDATLQGVSDTIDLLSAINGGTQGQVHWGQVRPRDVAVDSAGRYYILDIGYSKRVYRFTADFEYDNLVFDVRAQEGNPEALAIDPAGRIYVGGRQKRVFVYDAGGQFLFSHDLSAELSNTYSQVSALRMGPDGYWYVLDAFDDKVYRFDTDFTFTGHQWSTKFTDAGYRGTDAHGLVLRPDGTWLISDIGDDAFHMYDFDFTWSHSVPQQADDLLTGITPAVSGMPLTPLPEPVPESDPDWSGLSFWAVGSEHGQAYRYDSSWQFTGETIDLRATLNNGPLGQVHWGRMQPRDMVRDRQGRWYVLDIGYGKRVYRFTADFAFDGFWIDVADRESNPEGLAVTDQGAILVGGRSKQLFMYDSTGHYVQSIDVQAQLTSPSSQITGIQRARNGQWYILDSYDDQIHAYDSAFQYTGWTGTTHFGESQVKGNSPYGFTQLSNGNWIVTDIQDDALHLYDESFTYQASYPQSQDGWMTGLGVITPETSAEEPGSGDTAATFYWVTNYDEGCAYRFAADLTTVTDTVFFMPLINAGEQGMIHYGQSKPRDITRDSAGNWYVADIGYQDRVYRFRPDWTYDDFYIYAGGEDDFIESVEVGQDGLIYVGGRDRLVYVYSPEDGELLDSVSLKAQIMNPNGAIFGIRQGNDGRFYILEGQDDHVLVYNSDWSYAGVAYDYTFSNPPYDGTNGYGFERQPNGDWIISDIKYVNGVWTSEFNRYDSGFQYLETIEILQEGVISGVVRE